MQIMQMVECTYHMDLMDDELKEGGVENEKNN